MKFKIAVIFFYYWPVNLQPKKYLFTHLGTTVVTEPKLIPLQAFQELWWK